MNWERGFKRVWYFLLGVIWILAVVLAGAIGGAGLVGETIAYLLLFTLGWLLVGGALIWVARGFRKDPAVPRGPL